MTTTIRSRADATPVIRPSAVLWDMDGTLVDTEPVWDAAAAALAHRYGIAMTPDLATATRGVTPADTVDMIAAAADVTLSVDARACGVAWLQRRFVQQLVGPSAWRPGARALLVLLEAAHVPMALVTNTSREITDILLAHMGVTCFEFTLCGDEVPAPKPAPDIYREAAHRLGVDPTTALAIEDSTAGSSAAVAAGCPTLLVAPQPIDHRLIVTRPTLVGLTLDDLTTYR